MPFRELKSYNLSKNMEYPYHLNTAFSSQKHKFDHDKAFLSLTFSIFDTYSNVDAYSSLAVRPKNIGAKALVRGLEATLVAELARFPTWVAPQGNSGESGIAVHFLPVSCRRLICAPDLSVLRLCYLCSGFAICATLLQNLIAQMARPEHRWGIAVHSSIQ